MLSDEYMTWLLNKPGKSTYFEVLKDIYRNIPPTVCKCCGECCRHAPRVCLTEYLQIYGTMKDSLRGRFRSIVENTVEYAFLSLVDTSLHCPFLEHGKCLIYDSRSFNCRVWGHSTKEEYDSVIDKAKNDLVVQRDYWMSHFDIQIPDGSVYGHKAYCTDMKPTRNTSLKSDKKELLRQRLEKLDTLFIAENTGPDDWGFLELPLFVCFTFMPRRRFFNSRPHVMKEFLEKGSSGFLERLISDLLLPSPF